MKFSVIIPAYNRGYCVGTAIESALAQTAPPHEIIVVDDGSQDNTGEVVRRFGDKVRYLRQENRGLPAARNAGIEAATGDWLAFLDSDDWWLPDRLSKQQDALANSDAALGYCAYYLQHADGTRTVKRRPAPERIWPELRLKNCISGGSAVVVRKSAILETGGFDETLRAAEDWDMWVRLARRYAFSYVDEPLVVVTYGESSMSADTERMLSNTEVVMRKTLLSDLSGWSRACWERRIRCLALYHASSSIKARSLAAERAYLIRSLIEWPSPFFYKLRMKALAFNLMNSVLGGSRS